MVGCSSSRFEDEPLLVFVRPWSAQALGQVGAAALDQRGGPQGRVRRRNIHGVDYHMNLGGCESCKSGWRILHWNYAKFLQTAAIAVTMRIPRATGQRFHEDLDSDSMRIWTAIPRQSGHPLERGLAGR